MYDWFFIKFYNLNFKIKRWLKKKYYAFRNKWHMKAAGVEFEDDIRINGKILVTNNMGTIRIGKNVVLNSGSVPAPLGIAPMRLYARTKDSELIIGDNVGISSSIIFAAQSVILEDGAMIGSDCIITDYDFHGIHIDPETGMREDGDYAPVVIGKNAFVGTRCLVLKGVHIGEGSFVGGYSVVTKDIPAGEIWAGNPAKFIRKIESKG